MNLKVTIINSGLYLGLMLLGLTLWPLSAVLAQTRPATPSASSVDETTVKETLKKRLENSVEDKLEKVKGVLGDTSKYYAYVGEVISIDGKQLVLKRDGTEKKVNFDDKTTLIFTDKQGKTKTLKPTDVSVKGYALAMGRIDEQAVLLAQRIVFYEESPLVKPEVKVVFGKIGEIDNQKLILKNHEELSLTVDKKTNLRISTVAEAELADVTVDDKAVAVMRKSATDKEFVLKALFVWPGKASPEATDNQVNASASAKPASSAKPKP